MGTQTMGSHGEYGGAGVGGQEPQLDSLARQGSLYSLTLDEVQTQLGDLGKPLSSMNLDEFLKSVCSAEATQGGRVDTGGAVQEGHAASGSSLNRQSSLTLSRDLSKKTVDEVWQDIQQGQKRPNATTGRKVRERESTLGEMTLEDFLVRAGVVTEGETNSGAVLRVDPMPVPQENVPQQAPWMAYQMPRIHQPPQQQQQNMLTVFMPDHPVQQPLPISAHPVMDAYKETQMTISAMGALSDTQTPGRKRNAAGDVGERTVERRHKRMIKNRESAARSRARKQAYTHELENKVSRLEEENERLMKQLEFERGLPIVPPPETKYQLRRTSSASF